MKNEVPQPAPDVLAVLKRTSSKKLLKHVLSPLERAALLQASKAYKNALEDIAPTPPVLSYKPFNYKLEGISVYVSASACRQILLGVTEKLALINRLHQLDKARKNVPFELREIIDDPTLVLSLKPRLRNRLCRLECYTLFSISNKGRRYFAREQKFTAHNISTLDALFEKYGCSHLFI